MKEELVPGNGAIGGEVAVTLTVVGFTCRRLPLAQVFKVGIREIGCLGLP